MSFLSPIMMGEDEENIEEERRGDDDDEEEDIILEMIVKTMGRRRMRMNLYRVRVRGGLGLDFQP